jgi:hypothetical protein
MLIEMPDFLVTEGFISETLSDLLWESEFDFQISLGFFSFHISSDMQT